MVSLRVFGLLLFGFLLSASAQQPNAGTIVYEHAPNGQAPWPVIDIYSMSADGNNVRALTRDGHSHSPAWSPDGRRILVIHDTTLQRKSKELDSHHPVELCVMDRNGANRRVVRRLEPVIYGAAWSPQGRTLAVTYLPEQWVEATRNSFKRVNPGLFLFPAEGQGNPRLLFRNAYTPAWSPDGEKLAFSLESPRGNWTLHVANADGSGDVQLAGSGQMAGSPAWSPDGKLIAYDAFDTGGRRQQIFIMNTDGSGARQITHDPSWSCAHPSWSRDGSRIAFSCRSASAPCGAGFSDTGSIVPRCIRRVFVLSVRDSKAKPKQLTWDDSAGPAFGP